MVRPIASDTSTMPPLRQEEAVNLPTRFALDQNQPNPFSATTRVGFALPVASRVQLEVFDPQGRRVRTLAEGHFTAGRHEVEWDGRNAGGTALPAGVFIYRLRTGSFVQQKKLMLLPDRGD